MSANLALVRNPSPSMTLEVLVYHGSRQESRHALADGTYVVGSAPDATIRLVHPDVDSHHAVLLVSGGNVALKHLRPQAPAPRLLANIDTLQCGPFLLRTRIAVRSRSSERTPRSPAPELDRTKVAPRLQSVPNHVDPNQTRISRRETGSEAVVRTPTAERKSIGERRSTVERRAIPERRATVERKSSTELAQTAELGPLLARKATVDRRPAVERKPPQNRQPAERRPPQRRPDDRAAAAVPASSNQLFLDLHWGLAQQSARSFPADPHGVIADGDERAAMPLWGFTLPEGGMQLAAPDGEGFIVYLPPRAKTDRKLEVANGRRFVRVGPGQEVRFREGLMSLVARVGPVAPMPPAKRFADVPWLVVSLMACFGTLLSLFIALSPEVVETPHQAPVQAAAVKMVFEEKKPEPPEPPAVEEPAPAEAAAEEPAPAPAPKPKKRQPPQKTAAKSKPPPESKAMKMLSKISSAGPALKDVLGAVDKKGVPAVGRNPTPTLAGMIGTGAPNTGVGGLGLGSGGARGKGVPGGAGLLRGEGGEGIGAMGARGMGRGGSVRGQVTRASGRSLAVKGSIDRDAVAKVVNAHLSEVRACYERALLQEPGLAGKVVLEWSISTTGAVTMARTRTSTLKSSAVERCILTGLKKWRFPSAKGGEVLVSYPFLFNSVGY